MQLLLKNRSLLLGGALLAGLVLLLGLEMGCGKKEVDFNTQIRPILNSKCLSCHGGVKRKGDLSLLYREEALKAGESGRAAIVPGKPDASELMHRITHHDPEERMPRKKEPLTAAEVELFRNWIKEGAQWETHWAYQPPKKYRLPAARPASWPTNGIDHFVLARLNEAGLQPAPPAERHQLIRRLSLDLTGLPPSPEEVQAFLQDTSANAYEKVVDRLLESPHFGEKWAAMWLDLARYADSKGYEKDPYRSIWKFRDWVIKAFNNDMPFDQFTVEQLAGDLLPEPGRQQLIATAFHRNTMNNTEGGTEDEEYRIASVIDRINTTWTVWQSTTMECVQCHSHPYDPFKQEDYYKFFDFFNQSMDADLDDEFPFLEEFKEEDQAKIEEFLDQIAREEPGRSIAAQLPTVEKIKAALYPRVLITDCDDFQDLELYGNFTATNWARNPNNIPEKHFWLKFSQIDLSSISHISYTFKAAGDQAAIELRLDRPDGPLLHRLDLPKTARNYQQITGEVKATGLHDLFVIPINKQINAPEGRLTLKELYLHEKGAPPLNAKQMALRDSLIHYRTKAIRTPMMRDKSLKRQTFVFERGNWMVKGKPIEAAAVPAYLPQLPPQAPPNRLSMARWLVSPDNPLTARVIVNRFWEQVFGRGLVETTEDFGTQGARPSHPQLLDWLALHFAQELNWSVKSLLKTLVMSSTYRQDSRMRPELREKDPENRLLARGPRFRLSAEEIHDQALAVSGLLSRKMYGPSVMPPQPEGVWQVVYSGEQWKTSEGEDKYRRGIYTYWRRTSPYPAMVTFDAPSREFCISRRIRTNTPLQALVTLNDPLFVDAANALAKRMHTQGGSQLENQLAHGFRLAILRSPNPEELEVLKQLYQQAMHHYQTQQQMQDESLPVSTVSNREEEQHQLLALSVVANAILNLDSFVMKE